MINLKNKIIFVLTVLLCLIFVSSCSSSKDPKSIADADEIVINDSLDFKDPNIGLTDAGNRGNVSGSSSGSKISVVSDGFGNKTEMRCFDNHSRLLCVKVKTSADGNVEVTAMGQNGERNSVPKEMQGRVLTASPDEIANAAGITQRRSFNSEDKFPVTENVKDQNYPPLQPLTSDNFPIRRQEKQIENPPPQQLPPPDQPVEDDSEPETN